MIEDRPRAHHSDPLHQRQERDEVVGIAVLPAVARHPQVEADPVVPRQLQDPVDLGADLAADPSACSTCLGSREKVIGTPP